MPTSELSQKSRLPLTPRKWRLARLTAARLVVASGALRVWDRLANRGVPRIIYYHNVHGPGDDVSWCREPSLTMSLTLFRAHLESLLQHFSIVGLEEVVAAPSEHRLALTFDDGYRGIYDHAYPLLRQWGIPATIFLVTDRVGSADLLWWDRLLAAVEYLRALPALHQEAWLEVVTPLWRSLLQRAPLEQLLDAYKMTTGLERHAVDGALAGLQAVPRSAPHRIFLSAEEIRELGSAGFTFGAHTKSHPLLPWLDDDTLQEELVGSRAAVLSMTGQKTCWFSYPDGTFGEREQRAVVQAGFEGAVQTGRRPECSGRFALARVGISPGGITSADGKYSQWRSRWVLGRLTQQRVRGLIRQGERCKDA